MPFDACLSTSDCISPRGTAEAKTLAEDAGSTTTRIAIIGTGSYSIFFPPWFRNLGGPSPNDRKSRMSDTLEGVGGVHAAPLQWGALSRQQRGIPSLGWTEKMGAGRSDGLLASGTRGAAGVDPYFSPRPPCLGSRAGHRTKPGSTWLPDLTSRFISLDNPYRLFVSDPASFPHCCFLKPIAFLPRRIPRTALKTMLI